MLFNAAPKPEDAEAMKMHAQRQRAAIFALKELVRAKGAAANLSDLVQANFDMSPKDAKEAIDDAYRSLALVDQDGGGVLLSIVKDSIEDKNV